MNNSYVFQVVSETDQKPVFECRLPFLPRVGDDILFNGIGITVLKVVVKADDIKITVPDQQRILNPNQPQNFNMQELELIIPGLLLAAIADLNDTTDDNDSNDSNNSDNKVISITDIPKKNELNRES